jgi:hypothetical protein
LGTTASVILARETTTKERLGVAAPLLGEGSLVVKRKRTVKKQVASKKSASKKTTKKWSAKVTETSDAMTLQKSVFKKSPHAIALSLKRSAEKSHRRKSGPFRSAMSMLTFYINRAGKNLTVAQRKKLDVAKGELRKVFHQDEPAPDGV